MSIKERALARTTPPNTKPGRYRPPDQLLAFLEASDYADPGGPCMATSPPATTASTTPPHQQSG